MPVDKNLFQQISENSNLTKFAELPDRGKIRCGRIFQGVHRVAPTNNALATLDAAIVNDSAKLSQFVLNLSLPVVLHHAGNLSIAVVARW